MEQPIFLKHKIGLKQTSMRLAFAMGGLTALFFFSCREEVSPVSPVPDVVVQEQVSLNSVSSQELMLGDGRYIYISGGIKGIILYRKSSESYLAFERLSPYRMEDSCGILTVPVSRFFYGRYLT